MSFDVAVESLLTAWSPRIGRPTCGPGCSRCCERMTVIVSSAEALRLLEHIDSRPPLKRRIEPRIASSITRLEPALAGVDEDEALDRLLDLGPCVFLDSAGRCGVYEARPDACRSCHVWHAAAYCGRQDYDMCTPAELNELRVAEIHGLMRAEIRVGRRPFWGQLLPMVWFAGRFAQAYRAGEDLASRVAPEWTASGLIEFPVPGGSLAEIDGYLQAEARKDAAVFEREPSPHGQPRASEARDREFLAAFRLD